MSTRGNPEAVFRFDGVDVVWEPVSAEAPEQAASRPQYRCAICRRELVEVVAGRGRPRCCSRAMQLLAVKGTRPGGVAAA